MLTVPPESKTIPVAERASMGAPAPTLLYEHTLWRQGAGLVAGLDEVGRGPLAGPVVAAAVILPSTIGSAPWLARVRDSKVLSARQREALVGSIRADAVATGVGIVSAEEIDATGIVTATRRAMALALQECGALPGHLLIDALRLPAVGLPQTAIVHGDALCVSIACASIVAKVARDRLMAEMSPLYPVYGFAQNKGYGTPAHLDALRRHGPSPVHRRSFAPVRGLWEARP
jgi:ribonuclease HII